jgi:hypothetical protein
MSATATVSTSQAAGSIKANDNNSPKGKQKLPTNVFLWADRDEAAAPCFIKDIVDLEPVNEGGEYSRMVYSTADLYQGRIYGVWEGSL